MLKFLLGIVVLAWVAAGEHPLARLTLLVVGYGLYRLVRWARA